eukprot:SAG25_NODE_8317_length_428_cov_0.945289_1_plen_70_part_00
MPLEQAGSVLNVPRARNQTVVGLRVRPAAKVVLVQTGSVPNAHQDISLMVPEVFASRVQPDMPGLVECV